MTNHAPRLRVLLCTLLFLSSLTATAQIQVNSATPNAAAQGTLNLNVSVSGSGFKRGAQAQWFVAGTQNNGGVVVNSTTVNGSSSLTANITIPTSAVLSGYDIQVKNSDGRTGVGSDAFTVTQQGTPQNCYTTGTPTGATLQTVLNPVQSNGAALITTLRLGDAIRVRPLDLNHDGIVDTLVAFVTSGAGNGSVPGTYVFLLDPATGLPQTTNPITHSTWSNPILLLTGVRATQAAAGDVNGDGIPDFAFAGGTTTPYLFVGSVSATTYTPSWTPYPVSSSANTAVALGDVDGVGVDEIVLGGGGSGRHSPPGAVSIFRYSTGGVSYVRQIQDPTALSATGFGNAVAIGNIDGSPGNELVVGAAQGGTNGLVYVFPYPAQQSNYFTLTGPVAGFGRNLGIADVNLDRIPDLVVIAGSQDGTTSQALLFAGSIHPGSSYTSQLLPAAGLGNGWGNPNIDLGDLAATGAVAIGAANAIQDSSCNSIQGGQGVVHFYTSPFSYSEPPNYVFETPSLAGSAQFEFGYSVGVVPGYPFILIGEHFRDVGTTSMAGQVYVYKLN